MTYNPWADAAERYPRIHIERADVTPFHAAWMPTERVILIQHTLTKAERRCALAHELAHLDTGDRSNAMCWFDRRQESNADKLAARRLVDLADLVDVFRWCSTPGEAAAELEVTLAVIALRAQTMHPAERHALLAANSIRELVA